MPRVTLTFPVLNNAREVAFLVSGADKADAVARAFTEPPDPDAPAGRVRPARARCSSSSTRPRRPSSSG